MQRLEQSYGDYLQLPAQHQKMLTTFPKHIGDVRKAIDTNFDFVKLIVSSAVGMFENSDVSQFVSFSYDFNSIHLKGNTLKETA